MIRNDEELSVTRERITYLIDLLARLRVSSRPEELASVSGSYRAEVERMQREVLDYLTQPASPVKAARLTVGVDHAEQDVAPDGGRVSSSARQEVPPGGRRC
jgi:hypothetical protein